MALNDALGNQLLAASPSINWHCLDVSTNSLKPFAKGRDKVFAALIDGVREGKPIIVFIIQRNIKVFRIGDGLHDLVNMVVDIINIDRLARQFRYLEQRLLSF